MIDEKVIDFEDSERQNKEKNSKNKIKIKKRNRCINKLMFQPNIYKFEILPATKMN